MKTQKEAWRTVRLEDVCEHITVGHVGPMADQYVQSGIPFLRSQNVRPFRFDPTEIKFITPEFHGKLKKSALRPTDVVVTRSGANTGQCCIIPPGLTDANCSDLVILRPSAKLNPWFLMYVLNSDWGRATIAGGVVGAAQHHFNIGVARLFTIQLPPLPVQRRIAGILSAYDELIENSQRRIRLLEDMARALYREWFVHFRFPGHESVPRLPSALGDIPQGWEVKKLGDIADVNRAQINARSAPEELHYIDISSVSPGRIDSSTTYAFADAPGRARRIVQHGDILWSCVRPNRRSHALVMHPDPCTIASTGFAVLTPSKVPFPFLYFATTTDEFVKFLENSATGAAYPAVSAKTFDDSELLVPPSSLLEVFAKSAIPMAEEIHTLHLQIQNLRRTRDLLLPRLLSGECTFPTIPNIA
jgi:type I restriction enzyme S subunit